MTVATLGIAGGHHAPAPLVAPSTTSTIRHLDTNPDPNPNDTLETPLDPDPPNNVDLVHQRAARSVRWAPQLETVIPTPPDQRPTIDPRNIDPRPPTR